MSWSEAEEVSRIAEEEDRMELERQKAETKELEELGNLGQMRADGVNEDG